MLKRGLGATTLVAVAVGLAGAPSADAYSKCGSFKYKQDKIVVYKDKTTCKTSLKIVRDFRGGKRKFRAHGDGSAAGTYYTNAHWKGWRCFEGSGGGACQKGKQSASWQIPPSA